MINFFEKEDFNRYVYIYENEQVLCYQLGDICYDYAEITTTPNGVEPRYHCRGNELWDWGPSGQHPTMIKKFKSDKEALHACMLSYRYDLYNIDNNPIIYSDPQEIIIN